METGRQVWRTSFLENLPMYTRRLALFVSPRFPRSVSRGTVSLSYIFQLPCHRFGFCMAPQYPDLSRSHDGMNSGDRWLGLNGRI